MEEIFGLSMNIVMAVLLGTFIFVIGAVVISAALNRIVAKMGLRNIPRRKAQTVLIIVGVMLSTLIISAALGTGDTISFSIRHSTLEALGPIDEIIVSARATADDNFGSSSYITYERFKQIQRQATDLNIDGLNPQLVETAPTVNLKNSLSEARMRVVGIDHTLLEGFGTFTTTSGEEARLEDLSEGEAYINDRAAKELEAVAGDELRVIVGDNSILFKVKAVVDRGGIAGADSTLLLPLERAQRMFDRAGQVNLIVVSNRGDEVEGADLSDEVTEELRVLFSDREVVLQLKGLLGAEAVLNALEEKEQSLSESLREDIAKLRNELQRGELTDELISLLGERDINERILEVLEQDEFNEIEREAIDLFANRTEFFVFRVKGSFLEAADEAGSATTSFFLIMSLFSIMVGILLIFLIFVMLAAARRSEMGMARAVGAKRDHLVRMFLFEGTAYSLISAAVGVVLGLAVSALLVTVVNRIIATFEADFQLTRHFELRSAIVAYCLGMVITFATVAFSSYRVSRLNIVMAIRGLPEPLLPSQESPFLVRFVILLKAIAHPPIFLIQGLKSLLKLRFRGFLRNMGLAVLWAIPPFWIVYIAVGLLRFSWPYLLRGWLTFLLGLLLTVLDIRLWERDSLFGGGVSLVILGLGLMLRTGLKRTSIRAEVRDRIAFSLTGVVILVFWSLPPDTFKAITGDLQGDFDVMFVSGIAMVAAAVWTVMYNSDLLLKGLSAVTGRIGKLRPVLVTAVAYPMSAKFRTGLTLAMFAMVIFTLMVMSVLTNSFTASFSDDLETVVGGWDIQGSVNFNTPIENIRGDIESDPDLRIEDFEAIGGFTMVPIGIRQVDAENQQWHNYAIRAANDEFLETNEYKLKLIADGYGTTAEEVWRALKSDPTLAVTEGQAISTRPGADSEFGVIEEGIYYEDETMAPLDIEVREPRTGAVVRLTIIGVLDRVHESFDEFLGLIVSKSALDNAVPFPVPITTYQFKVAEGADMDQIAKELEVSFQEHGMEAVVLQDQFEEGLAAFRAFINMFIGFMALGLVVGVAALGVVSTRAVVERRQQIGVLRAIGYKRRMVQLSFMLESSFIALFGTAIGVILGLILSYNAIADIRAEEGEENLRWVVPWLQIVLIIAGTYIFALIATFIPARQASRIYPAEALRYE